MTVATKRKKLQDVIGSADDKSVETIYAIVNGETTKNLGNYEPLNREAKLELMKQASNDPLFLADLDEIKSDFEFLDK